MSKVSELLVCASNGNFAIQLIGDDSVLAAVASKTSNAFFKQGALHMSSDDIIQSRNALDSKGPMRLLRFEGDPLFNLKDKPLLMFMHDWPVPATAGRPRLGLQRDTAMPTWKRRTPCRYSG